jgi:cell division protein DivIC
VRAKVASVAGKRTLNWRGGGRRQVFEISFTPGARGGLMSGQLVNTRQLVTAVYVVIIAGLGLGAAALFNDAYQEYTRLKQNEASLQRKLADAQARLVEQETILNRLKTDPEYVEKVLRKRGYVKPEQQVFDFRASK